MDSEDFMTKIHLQDLTHFFLGIVKQMRVLEHFVRPVLSWNAAERRALPVRRSLV